MRKRFFAALLSFVMIFSLLPTSVLAADSGVIESALLSYETWLQGGVDAKDYVYDYGGTFTGILSRGKVQVGAGETVQDKGGMTAGPTYAGIMVVTDFSGDGIGGPPLVFNSNSDVVEASVALDGKDKLIVTFTGKKDGTATVRVNFGAMYKYVGGIADGDEYPTAGYLIYTVTVGNGGSGGTTDPDNKPSKPDAGEFGKWSSKYQKYLAVYMDCENRSDAQHDTYVSSSTFAKLPQGENGYYTISDVVANDGTHYDSDGKLVSKDRYPWMCTMTIYTNAFVGMYNKNMSITHYLSANMPKTITVNWYYSNGDWYYDGSAPIVINITHKKPSQNEFTLIYNENAPTGKTADDVTDMPNPKEVKESDTSTSHTFTISSNVPKCEGYVFQGWSTTLDGTAEYQPKGEITISKDTNLYAVWHQHTDGNGDGFCDDDNTCMHPKDENTGYCKVDDCNHPHEGEGACCPKPSSEPSKPTEDQQKDMLTGKIKVTCVLDDENLGRKENEAHQPAGVYALEAGGYSRCGAGQFHARRRTGARSRQKQWHPQCWSCLAHSRL